MADLSATLTRRGFGGTLRRDLWWLQPVATFLGLGAFIVYSTWAAFQNAHYEYGPYLSPMYSPLLFGDSPHAWFGATPPFWPAFLPFSPALLILWAPGGFRFTCYYYRGAYYKAFWADPPSCAVGEPRSTYWGERSFPLILQNIHRYFFYLAALFIVILSWDALKGFFFADETGGTHFGVGVGSLVLVVNVVLLGGYTFSCHSLRHLVGGRKDEVSTNALRWSCYTACSAMNRRHQLFAWLSLCSVGFADIYVRLCSMGIWTDYRLL
ncbi:MAG TPA: succinate dehydrogenase [Candidatus Polarisedimenticolia bacterium]|nr:succinate dehydrogenase [Candidatus Polarisedimenticolia bacterium]